MKIDVEFLQKNTNQSSYKKNGAEPEIVYEHYIAKDFSNSELYWKKFIIPTTNRIDFVSNKDYTRNRDGISEDLLDIGSFHYSIFINLIYAHQILSHITSKKASPYFENFYTYLGTVCDLVEEFLFKVYFIVIESKKIESKILKKLTKAEFLEIAQEMYDKKYLQLYDYYLKNGRGYPLRIPQREYVLKEYFGDSDSWKAYYKFSSLIRGYRNVVLHHHVIAFINYNAQALVPTKEVIAKYKRWQDVEKLITENDNEKIKNEFIAREVLVAQDILQIKKVLQDLWVKPIDDMNELLYVKKNEVLLKKCNLEF
ncbi:hypothetical protein BH10BAC2_BH10BAC2_22500 [soil metagenome]